MKLCFTFACLCIGLLLPARAAAPTNQPANPIRYFLFLIDTSSSMLAQKETAMDTVHKLLLSGINGRMKAGDVFSIWTFNDRVYTNRYAAQRWIPSRNQDIANRAYRFLRDQRFSKKPRMDLAVAAMKDVVQRADAMTLLLFTDGSHLLKGTPFDEPINSIFNKHAEGMRNAKKPFVTAFIAQAGKLVAHAVSPAGGPIYIPPTMAEKNAQTESKETAAPPREIAETRQNNAPEQNAPVPPTTDPASTNRPKPLTVEQISALLRESQKKRAAEAATNAPAPVAVASENVKADAAPLEATARTTQEPPKSATPATSPTNPREQAPTDAAVRNTSPPPAPTSASLASPQSQTAGTLEKSKDASIPSSGSSPDEAGGTDVQPPASPQTATVMAPEPVRDSQSYLFVGLGLLVVALASALLLFRNRRSAPQPSLISRSIDDGKR